MYQMKMRISWLTMLKTRPIGEELPFLDFDQGGQQTVLSDSSLL